MLNEKQKALSKKYIHLSSLINTEETDKQHLHALYTHAGLLRDFIEKDDQGAMRHFLLLLKKLCTVLKEEELTWQILVINKFLIAITDSERYSIVNYPEVDCRVVIEILDNVEEREFYIINMEMIPPVTH